MEHSSVLAPARELEREGVEVAVIPVDRSGLVDPDEVARAAAGARLVSVMAANNEIGSCMPLAEIGERLRKLAPRPHFHTDAVQALGRSPVTLKAWGADLASFSAHKVGGPTGVGVLVRRARGQVGPVRRSIIVDDVVLEPGALRAVRDGRDLGLTSYEFNILYALAERRGRVCTREQLIEAAGGTADGAFERSIDVHVSRVRQKLGDDARQPQILKTVRGAGYLFARPAEEE